jgi:hypothetical protein
MVMTSNTQKSVLKGDSNFDSVLEEAAIQYSHGDSSTALKTISNAMTKIIGKEKGLNDKRLWYILMDMLDDDPAKTDVYNKTVEAFILNFAVTPPQKRFSQSPIKVNYNWSANLSIQNSIALITEDKKRDFIRSLPTAKACTLDLSRTKIDEQDEFLEKSLNSLWEIFKAISDAKKPIVLMGEARFLEELEQYLLTEIDFQNRKKMGKSFSRNDKENFAKKIASYETTWNVVLELHQWRGQEVEFDKWFELYIDFWNKAPIGYELSKVLAITQPNESKESIEKYEDILPEIISDKEMDTIIINLEKQYRNEKKIFINLSKTKRIFYDASVKLASWLKTLQDNEKMDRTQCIIFEPSTPVLIILNLTGVLALCHVKQRKL